MRATPTELEGVVRMERAQMDLRDARTLMTQALSFIDDSIDRNRILSAMENVEKAESMMISMVLEIYKRGLGA